MSLPGHLDIGTTYTSSRIRCNAELGGYTGYDELKAASSYDMFLNLSTTRTDGGWMYFKINNDDYMQLSGSDNKVNMYKDTTISGHLDAQRLTLNKPSNDSETPLKLTNNNPNWEVMALESTIAGDGCLQHFRTAQSPIVWNTGVWNQNQYGIRHGVHGFWIYDNGNTPISGNLDVGPGQANTSIQTYVNYGGHAGNVEIEARWQYEAYVHFNTTCVHGLLVFATKQVKYMFCGLDQMYFYKPTTNASDDRLKGIGELKKNLVENYPK